jgi:hypothetical protein
MGPLGSTSAYARASLSGHLVELRPEVFDRCASVGAGVVGGVLGNGQRPFGLVHRVLARRILALLEVHQGVAKPDSSPRFGGRWARWRKFRNRSIRSATLRRAVARAVGLRVISGSGYRIFHDASPPPLHFNGLG